MITQMPASTTSDIGEVCDAISRCHAAARRRPLLVAIDGIGGAGKSTLAGAVAARLGATIVEGDDFYRDMPAAERNALSAAQGADRYFDHQRLRAEVLAPLRRGRPARYLRYDWDAGRLGSAQAVVAADAELLLVEGVYTSRRQLRDLLDMVVWVETSPQLCHARMLERDQNPVEWIGRWQAAERYYVEAEQPAARADIVFAGG
jgi:uridine kinase